MSTPEKRGFWPLIKLLPVKTNFRFVAIARFAAVLSVVLVVASLARMLIPFEPPCGGLNCGVDFKGGTALEMTSPRPIDLGALRASLNAQNLGDVQVQQFGAATSAVAKFEPPEGQDANAVVEQVKTRLQAQLGNDVKFSQYVVGAKVSGELLTGGVLALFAAIGLMLVYIWFRFELQFGLGAVVALFHDVILTFGLFAFFRLEFGLTEVAAVLTIIGYSMNDTVVVFDRMRENLRKYKKMPLAELIDLSINETLSRTIITGLTGLLALAGLAILGGEALFSFSVAMIFGIVIGTYSSVFVAAPVVLLWGVRKRDDVEIIKPQAARP